MKRQRGENLVRGKLGETRVKLGEAVKDLEAEGGAAVLAAGEAPRQ